MALVTQGGRSLVSLGLPALLTLGTAPLAVPGEFFTREDGTIGVLTLEPLATGFMSSFNYAGIEMASGVAPFSMFSADNPLNPLIGFAFDSSTVININAFSTAGAPSFGPTLTALRPFNEKEDGRTQEQAIDQGVNAMGLRSPGLWVGPAAPATIAPGGVTVFTMIIVKRVFLGHLVLGPNNADLTIDDISLAGDSLSAGRPGASPYASDSQASPGFGHEIRPGNVLTVAVRNNGIAAVADVCPAWSCLNKNRNASALFSRRASVAA